MADDFTEVAVESAPYLARSKVEESFVILELDGRQSLPEKVQTIDGEYYFESGRIIFCPKSPFNPGTTYRAVFRYGRKRLERDFYVTRFNHQTQTRVENIYPSAPFFPQNIQRFYIEFSNSMQSGFVAENIHLVNLDGDTVKNAFLDIASENWSEDMRRLRIDLKPIPFVKEPTYRQSLNKRFQLFKKYRLIIEDNMRDVNGSKLNNDYYKQYTVHGANWNHSGGFLKNILPAVGTKDPVILTSQKAHDYISLNRDLIVTDSLGKVIPGKVEVTDFEKTWKFYPEVTWQAKEYQVRIGNSLEDLAGNTRISRVISYNWTTPAVDSLKKNHGYRSFSFRPRQD